MLPAKIAMIAVFFVIFILGIVGLTQMETNFRIEWFFPENSYVKQYVDLNNEYFRAGTTLHVFLKEVDLFEKQAAMNQVSEYLEVQDFFTPNSAKDWWKAFSGRGTPQTDKTTFWNSLWTWYQTDAGQQYKSSIKWTDSDCNDKTKWADCSPTQGVIAARIGVSMKSFGDDGYYRYSVMRTMREDMNDIIKDDSGHKLFPYTREFLYFEEVGVISEELTRNLTIAGGIIIMIICVLVPDPRIAVLIALNIILSMVEVVGIAHFWGITFMGVSTIYFLICLGLSVDYSAHIGHMFKVSEGTAQERALGSLVRIGPSVFHAIFSTLLAVIVIGTAKSFIFEVFFKVLFLVTLISGSHGLLLLPVLLSICGGNLAKSTEQPKELNDVRVEEGQGEVKVTVDGDAKVKEGVIGKQVTPDADSAEVPAEIPVPGLPTK